MRIVFLVAAVFFVFFGLLIAFSNVRGSNFPVNILFTPLANVPLTVPFILMMGIGFVAGIFAALFFISRKDNEEDSDVFN